MIYENINNLIKQKGLTKKEFAEKLINLKPNVNRIGETPSLSAIYAYLNGSSSIKADLIPYIAEVLGVTEQEIFDNSKEARKKCFKYFLENATKEELEYFNNFLNSQINNIHINYGKIVMNSNENELDNLLEYAPKPLIEKLIKKLKEIKNFTDNL